MSATIKDIAKAAGVSPSTVSRVINGTAPISDEVKFRIRETMKELDYHPNAAARSFATGRANTAALVLDASDEAAFSNSFFNRSVYAVEKVLQENEYNLLIANDNGRDDSQILSLVQEKKVDGLIIPPSSLDSRLVRFLKKAEFPYVVMGEPETGRDEVSWVDVDNEQGAVEGTLHLLRRGYSRVVMIVNDDSTVFSRKRIRGYEKTVRMRCEGRTMMTHDKYEEFVENLADEGAELNDTGFLCSSNEIAFYALRALKKAGVSVPEGSGIVTFDNYPFAAYMDPPLTAIDVDTYSLGARAAEMLMSHIRGEKTAAHQLIKTELIERGSTERKG